MQYGQILNVAEGSQKMRKQKKCTRFGIMRVIVDFEKSSFSVVMGKGVRKIKLRKEQEVKKWKNSQITNLRSFAAKKGIDIRQLIQRNIR